LGNDPIKLGSALTKGLPRLEHHIGELKKWIDLSKDSAALAKKVVLVADLLLIAHSLSSLKVPSLYSKERMVDAGDIDVAAIAAEYGVGPTPDPAPVQEALPMPRRAIEELGELLVRHVRDVAIRSCDLQLTPQSDTPVARRWRRAAIASGGAVPPQVLIPDCVDETILAFLRAIEQGLLRLSFTAASFDTVDLAKEGGGELGARYMASDGWRARYSKERFADDAADLEPA
jgi:hypothetical protein